MPNSSMLAYYKMNVVVTFRQCLQVDLLHLRMLGPDDLASVHVHGDGWLLAPHLDHDRALVITGGHTNKYWIWMSKQYLVFTNILRLA